MRLFMGLSTRKLTFERAALDHLCSSGAAFRHELARLLHRIEARWKPDRTGI